MKQSVLTAMAIVFLTAAFSSCVTIREDVDDCPFDLRILVKLEAEELGVSPLPGHDIRTVQVFAFDASTGLFVTSWEGGPYTPGTDYAVPFDLPTGDYRLVAWTNLHEEIYGISHSDIDLHGVHIDNIDLFRNMLPDAKITSDLPDLLHGTQDAQIDRTRNTTVTILIRPLIYRVTYIVTGLPETDHEYGFTVSDHDFTFDFDGVPDHGADPEPFFYERTARFTELDGEPVVTATMTMVGLDDAAWRIPPEFTFTDLTDGHQYYPDTGTADLIDMIVLSYKAQHGGAAPDFDGVFEFLVPLRFETNLGMDLDLRPWDYKEDEWILQ